MIKDYKFVHKGQPIRKSRKNPAQWARFTVLVSVIILTTVFFLSLYADSKKEVPLTKVVVKSGDTLWSLAHQFDYSNGNIDIRKLIYEIKEINQLTSAQIHPGQVIYIPLMD